MRRYAVTISIALAALWLAACTTAEAADAKKPVKVFVLAGQSNMQGHALLRTLDHLGKDPKYGDLLKKLKNADGSYTVRDDVWIYYDRGKPGVKKGPLTAGYGASDQEIGPEWMFGQIMGDRYDNTVLLIKTAWGGASLAVDFRPPSAGDLPLATYPEAARKKFETGIKDGTIVPGAKYRQMIETVRKVLGNLKAEFPQYEDQGCELAGFFWFQGWNDMITTEFSAEYEKNMVALIKDVRKDLGAANLPVVIAVMGVDGKKANEKILALRKAQNAAGDRPEFKGNVACVQTADYWDDEAAELVEKFWIKRKWTDEEAQKKYDTMGSQPAYHYLGSAKILSLVGYGCAEAMKTMCK
ncbi:MAG: sialate O-acetylesterase [Planctomycetota bacterium]|nr:sialate O-acetylesterase [Planctomycetota bacterium]